MCGFSGIIFSGNRAREDFLPGLNAFRKSAVRISHRGDTAHNEAIFDRLWLSHYRLAFQDVTSGSQPMLSHDSRHIIVFNGELYNHLTLRNEITRKSGIEFRTRSDTETILEAWKAFGEDIFSEFDGEYAFVISDVEGRELIAHRDHFGVKPLFFYLESTATEPFSCFKEKYLFKSSRLEFASEIKGLASKREWNRDGLLRQFTGLYEPIRTPFNHVIHLPAGGILKAELVQNRLECTLTTNAQPIRFKPEGRAMPSDEDMLVSTLSESVKDRLLSDVELGVYQSGGVDSKVIAYELSRVKQSADPIKSFTVGFEKSGYDETAEAQAFSRYLGFEQHIIKVNDEALNYSYPHAVVTSELVQPYTNGAAKWWLSLFARQYVQGVFTGDGADEIFCGYPSYRYVNWWKSAMRARGNATTVDNVLSLIEKYPLGSMKRDSLYLKRFASHAENPWLSGSSAEGDGSDFIESLQTLGVPHPLYGQIKTITESLLGEMHAATWLQEQTESVRSWYCSGLEDLKDHCADPAYALLFWQNYFARAHLPVLILNWVGDRMEMANTLEGRTPFLSKRMFQFMQNQPDHALVSGLRDKVLLRRAYSGLIPPQFASTPKKQFNAPFLNSQKLIDRYKTESIFELTGMTDNNSFIKMSENVNINENSYQATHLKTAYQTAISLSIVHDSLIENHEVERDVSLEARYLSSGGRSK